MASKKDLLRKFLKGIETGDAMAAAVVDEARYIQHNPQTHEGGEGLAVLFARLARTNPKVRFVRVFEDGEFAFAHNEYDFASLRVAFEVFRFDGDRAVEHWDNIQPMQGPNASGRGMLDGSVEIAGHEKTETNRDTVRAYTEAVLVGCDLARLSAFVADDLIQHSPVMPDGAGPLRAALQAQTGAVRDIEYHRLHRVLAEGNFVLAISEGARGGVHSSFYDLYRLADGRIVEHWDTIETIPPRREWKNLNGKF